MKQTLLWPQDLDDDTWHTWLWVSLLWWGLVIGGFPLHCLVSWWFLLLLLSCIGSSDSVFWFLDSISLLFSSLTLWVTYSSSFRRKDAWKVIFLKDLVHLKMLLYYPHTWVITFLVWNFNLESLSCRTLVTIMHHLSVSSVPLANIRSSILCDLYSPLPSPSSGS